MKTCKICGANKPLSEFHRCPVTNDGYRNECKPCRSVIEHKRAMSKRVETRAYNIKYQADNKHKLIEYDRKRGESNRKELKDPYLKLLIRRELKINSEYVTKEMIELKRAILTAKRIIWRKNEHCGA